MTDEKTKIEEKPFSANKLLDEVKAERLALEKARDEAKAQADRLEQLKAETLLSGSAGIRQEMPQLSPEEQKKKAAMDFWKGSGIDDAIAKYNG